MATTECGLFQCFVWENADNAQSTGNSFLWKWNHPKDRNYPSKLGPYFKCQGHSYFRVNEP